MDLSVKGRFTVCIFSIIFASVSGKIFGEKQVDVKAGLCHVTAERKVLFLQLHLTTTINNCNFFITRHLDYRFCYWMFSDWLYTVEPHTRFWTTNGRNPFCCYIFKQADFLKLQFSDCLSSKLFFQYVKHHKMASQGRCFIFSGSTCQYDFHKENPICVSK